MDNVNKKSSYGIELEKRLNAMCLFEREYMQDIRISSIDEFMLQGYELILREFQKNLRFFIESAILEKGIKSGVNKYEPVLRLKYQEKVFKDVPQELLMEFMYEESVLMNGEVKASFEELYAFYLSHKADIEMVVKRVKEYESVRNELLGVV